MEYWIVPSQPPTRETTPEIRRSISRSSSSVAVTHERLSTGGVTVVRLGTSGRAAAHITGRHGWIRRLVLASVPWPYLAHPKSRPQCVFRPSAHVAAARGSRRRWRRSTRRSSPVSRRAAASVQSPLRLPCDGRRACGWPQREPDRGAWASRSVSQASTSPTLPTATTNVAASSTFARSRCARASLARACASRTRRRASTFEVFPAMSAP